VSSLFRRLIKCRAEILNISTDAEVRPHAAQQDATYRGIGFRLTKDIRKFLHHRRSKRIARLGTIQSDSSAMLPHLK
jgi:hypothetical protein